MYNVSVLSGSSFIELAETHSIHTAYILCPLVSRAQICSLVWLMHDGQSSCALFVCPLCTCRAISIMREARAKLRLIKPEDMDMDEYMVMSLV